MCLIVDDELSISSSASPGYQLELLKIYIHNFSIAEQRLSIIICSKHHQSLQFFSTSIKRQRYKMSTEAAAAIVFGILQVGIGLAALWQQRQAQARQLQRKTPPKRTSLKRLTSFQV